MTFELIRSSNGSIYVYDSRNKFEFDIRNDIDIYKVFPFDVNTILKLVNGKMMFCYIYGKDMFCKSVENMHINYSQAVKDFGSDENLKEAIRNNRFVYLEYENTFIFRAKFQDLIDHLEKTK